MAGSLESVLAGIPGYGGYLAKKRYDEQSAAAAQRQQFGQVQQMRSLQDILSHIQNQQQQEQMRGAMSDSGGDPEKALEIALKSGNVNAAHQLAPLVKMKQEQRMKEEATRGMRELNAPPVPPTQQPMVAPQDPKMIPAGSPLTPAAPTDQGQQRVAHLQKMMELYASHPAVVQRIQAQIDKIQKPAESKTRTFKADVNVAGGRESVYVQRMMMGANQAAKDLANVVQLPLTASTGLFGGRKQGAGLFDAGKEVLANKATGQEAQAYNAMATGFQRSLAQIESAGLMPSGSLTHQMDAVLFKEGDTNLTKLHKLAQTRQIVEAGMEVIEANPRVSPPEKAKIKSVLESIRKSVPFTHSDLIQLQVAQDSNPNATLGDVIKGKGSGATGGWSIRPR